MGQNETYAEYSRTGQLIRGKERAKARSKYQEDCRWPNLYVSEVAHLILLDYINNHTQIWGSFYDINTRQWGYACCHSLIQASYCTGQAGIEAANASTAEALLRLDKENRQARTESNTERPNAAEGEGQAGSRKEERKRKAAEVDEDPKGEKRRKYNDAEANMDVTEDELGKFREYLASSCIDHFAEAYRRSRLAGTEDPMFNYTDAGD